jgi:hypothetical protein
VHRLRRRHGPWLPDRAEAEKAAAELGRLWETNDAGIDFRAGMNSEIYTVRETVWKKAGVEFSGGCLCIGCLEKRIGRRLRPKDFQADHGSTSSRARGC